jgi:hypothetical protein
MVTAMETTTLLVSAITESPRIVLQTFADRALRRVTCKRREPSRFPRITLECLGEED